MRFEEIIIILALTAGIFSKANHREAMLAFTYAIIIGAFTWLFPNPSVFAHVGYEWWYISCASAEAMIISAAWIINAPASPYLALCSTANLIVNIAAYGEYIMGSTSLYDVYSKFIPSMEITQVVFLFLFSWPFIHLWAVTKDRYQSMKKKHHHDLRQSI